jgi:hypothetical protein
MRDRQTCIGCGKQSPETETNYTLISAQFGWRLTRRRTEAGEFAIEWRCPECWRDHKKKTQDDPSSASMRHMPVAHVAPAIARPSLRSSRPPRPRGSSAPPDASSPAARDSRRRPPT